MITEVNAFTSGWVTYFRHIQNPAVLRYLDGWLRRKLRCARLKQCKRAVTLAAFLQDNGVPAPRAWCLAGSGRGWWRLAGSPPAHEAMRTAWFGRQGLVSLTDRHAALNAVGNRRLR
jgi:RNA-directed DNA polymerase